MKIKSFKNLGLLLTTCFSLITVVNNAQIIVTAAGTSAPGNSGNGGQAISAQLNSPYGVTFDANGNYYIADYANSLIRKVNPSGIITTVAGSTQGYSGDGGPATAAQLSYPIATAFDGAGNMYIAEYGNKVIRKVNTSGIISTFAGTGTAGYSGDGGPATAAQFNWISGLAADPSGNVYVSDFTSNVIRKINTAGIISTFAGNGTSGYTGDGGPATAAQFASVKGITLDATGNLYAADYNNTCIRKVNTSGIITTVGPVLTWAGPNNVAVHPNTGDVYFSTPGNYGNPPLENVIYVLTAASGFSTYSTYAGGGICTPTITTYCGDGGAATNAVLYRPQGIAFDPYGDLFIADMSNNVIREVGRCIPATPSICMVEVDTLSKNNIVYWQKGYPADTIYIYRDTANYNYALIGKVANSAYSTFTDTVRHLYAANGDPNASSWRYKIAYNDTCGGGHRISPMSPFHQTVFMLNGASGNFIWTQYQIEGESQPVSQLISYYFEVDSFSNGHYHLVQSLSASSTFYHDAQYLNYPSPTWRCTGVGFNCTPSFKFSGGGNSTQSARVKSHSNTNANRSAPAGIKTLTGNNPFSIYPNPSADFVNIQSPKEIGSIVFYNALGETVWQVTSKNTLEQIDISKLPAGVYTIQVQGKYKKLIKE